MRVWLSFLLVGLWVGCASAVEIVAVSSQTEPFIEGGFFAGGGAVPDYPGSNQMHARWLAFPFIIVRGKVIRTDDQSGVKARLFRRERFDVDLGFAGSFPVSSSHNEARRGMPDLDYLGEVGPRGTVLLSRLRDGGSFKLLLPLRAVFSTNLKNLHNRGFVAAPTLSLELPEFLSTSWLGLAQLTSNFGSRQINSYVYDVDAAFATPERQAYNARAGYMGSHLFLGLGSPRKKRFRFFTGVEYARYDAVSNLASPLFKSRDGTTLVAGFTWVFYQSLRPGYE